MRSSMAGQVAEPRMTVDAELQVPLATARLVRFHVRKPADDLLRDDEAYWLDLCLTPRPRNVRASYVERWAADRFEPIGDMFLLPPGQTMRARSEGGPTQASVLCHLRPEPLRQWFGGELEWTDCRLETILNIQDRNLRGLLLRLSEELGRPGFASETLVELMIAQLAIELGRYCVTIKERPNGGGLSPWRLRLIDARLREISQPPALAELAALCNMSVRQLTRAFRSSRGQSIGDHIAQCRIDHAKRLLSTDSSIKAAAYTLGFASPSSFSFAFRRATGQTPREFQARCARRGRAR